MQITFDPATATPQEVTAIQAVIDVFHPRAPAPPVPTSLADALIAQEAARVAALAPAAPMNVGDTVTGAIEGTVVAVTPERDIHGVPWDERIHASTKAKNADGSWRTKRGADPALVAKISAELTGNAPVPAAPVPPPPPAAPTSLAEAVAADPPPVPQEPVAPPAPPATVAPSSDAPTVAERFKAIMKTLGPEMQPGGRVSMLQVSEWLGMIGVAQLAGLLTTSPENLSTFEALLTSHLAS